jgi:hypothetical protein
MVAVSKPKKAGIDRLDLHVSEQATDQYDDSDE